jgi:outer membrane protein TolC
MLILVFSANPAQADEALSLKSLIAEALKNNREIQAAEARWKASTYRVRQAESLPDPMVMVGYQNDGWDNYTFGKMEGAMWMYSVSQMFPFPGKRSLKGDMAGRDAESLDASYETVRLRTIAAVKELYYELFLAYKTLDLVRDRTSLFSRIEDAAVARYSAGMAPQQELLMAQTEKYMLLERETMLRQKILSLEAMLNNAAGRETNAPPGRPPESAPSEFALPLDDALTTAYRNSPEIRSKERMIASSRARIGMAEKEYFPDFTLAASVFKRSGEFEDMWSLTATVNVPLYFNTKRHAVYEAKALSYEAQSELEATKLMLTSSLRDNYSMLGAADRLMGLYKDGLIPKTYQDFDSALSGYVSGKVEAITVISRLKALLDFETLYWGQFVEREKAIARIEALAGIVSH